MAALISFKSIFRAGATAAGRHCRAPSTHGRTIGSGTVDECFNLAVMLIEQLRFRRVVGAISFFIVRISVPVVDLVTATVIVELRLVIVRATMRVVIVPVQVGAGALRVVVVVLLLLVSLLRQLLELL